MTNHRGFTAVTALLIVLGIIVVGGVGYVALKPGVTEAPTEEGGATQTQTEEKKATSSEPVISWEFVAAGEINAIPHTKVLLTIDGKVQDMGSYQGSCSEVGASGGVDGKGLLAGELSAVQCWFAGGGDEIGVFANEGGGLDVMVGELEEPIEGSAGFRGNFVQKLTF